MTRVRTTDQLTLVEHLAELRTRLIIALVAVAVGGVLVFTLYDVILGVILRPYEQVTGSNTLYIRSPLEGFAARLKVAVYGGLLLGSPVVLWEIWRFVTPGLRKSERRMAVPFMVASVSLFFGGAALAYFTFPQALGFLVAISGNNVETLFSPIDYVTFWMKVVLAFGIAFEFPIMLVFLQLVGVLTPRRLLGWWRWAIVGVFAAAAVITPSQDPITMLAMAVPMCVLYFGAIGVGKLLRR
ncbi:MAG: twin-arginine translocase subunit TatC [Acidimicrobiales bacterium]